MISTPTNRPCDGDFRAAPVLHTKIKTFDLYLLLSYRGHINDLFLVTGEEELEISPYDDTVMDTRMASLVAGKFLFEDTKRKYSTQVHKIKIYYLLLRAKIRITEVIAEVIF